MPAEMVSVRVTTIDLEPGGVNGAANVRVADVGLTSANTYCVPAPSAVKPAPTAVAVAVVLKSVPVKVMTVPSGEPKAIAVGEDDVIVGPAMEIAASNEPLVPVPLLTSTPSVPAVAPVPTVTEHVNVSPLRLAMQGLIVTPPAAVDPVPANATTAL